MAYQFYTKLSNAKNYGSTRSASSIKYLVYHYTANKTDKASSNANYFANNVVKASAHYFVDDTSVYQSVPDLTIAYSVGGSKYANCSITGGGKMYRVITNSNSISIEMCSNDGCISEATLKNAIELGKSLMEKYNIPITNVYRHFDVTGKSCPGWSGWIDSNPIHWNELKKGLEATPTPQPTPVQTIPTPPPTQSNVLKHGDRGDAVKKLQTMLNACGFNCGTPDGIFGSGTKTAVKAMQKHFGITQDGIYGTTSKSKLESMYNTNGLSNSAINGVWYYYKYGIIDTGFTGLAQNKNGWFYIKKGQVDFSYNGLVKNNQGWWAVHKGKVDFNYNGFESNDQGTWYCEKGKITFNKTDVIKDSKTGIWWNVIKSKVTPGITVAKNVNGWWYIDKNGKVDFNFNGLAKNQYGTWVIEKGKVNFNYNGKYTYNGKNYNIKDGKVI